MDITMGMAGEIPVISVSGRLDAISSPLLEEQLRPLLSDSSVENHLILEAAGLTYASSAGLRVFLLVHRKLSARGGRLAFAGLTRQVRDLFHLAGLHELFVIEESVEAASLRLA